MGSISSRVAGRSFSQSITAWAVDRPRPRDRGARISPLGRRVLKVRDPPEKIEALVNLLARQVLQPTGAEALHREGAHHASVKHRSADRLPPQLRLPVDLSLRTRAWRPGSMLARKRYSLSVYAAGIFGSNFSNTFRSVPRVCASLSVPS